jgi:prepilin-type N-terminal cleavage/methylation domain-containing protein
MTRRASESGFTLLEILVASLLLAMLITILTMVFNSSSIAWSTGKASVAEMDKVRNNMSAASQVTDNAMPRVSLDRPEDWGYSVGPWKPDGQPRSRAIVKMTVNPVANQVWNTLQIRFDTPQKGQTGPGSWARATGKPLWVTLQADSVTISGNAKAYSVGVWSLGPDGKENSGDDISTWPDAE